MPRDAAYPRDFFGNPLGLYEKYHVERVDGQSGPQGRHHKCSYFVLDLTHDPHAFSAIVGYVASCHVTHPELADDLRKWLAENAPQPNDAEQKATWVETLKNWAAKKVKVSPDCPECKSSDTVWIVENVHVCHQCSLTFRS